MWFRKAADRGDTNAEFYLGAMYAQSQGVSQSYKKALEWCRKAVGQGQADAQFDLESMYETGMGVPQSYK